MAEETAKRAASPNGGGGKKYRRHEIWEKMDENS
jgi:hypothetical protein